MDTPVSQPRGTGLSAGNGNILMCLTTGYVTECYDRDRDIGMATLESRYLRHGMFQLPGTGPTTGDGDTGMGTLA